MTVNLKYDTDPEALAWAREKVQRFIDKLRDFEAQAKAAESPEREHQWRVAANMTESYLIGGHGCVIASFDERMPTFAPILAGANRRAHSGVREPSEPPKVARLGHRYTPDDEGNCWTCGNEREHRSHRADDSTEPSDPAANR